jgi:hypothetical protein
MIGKARIAHLAGPKHNSEHPASGDLQQGEGKHNLAPLTNPDATPAQFDVVARGCPRTGLSRPGPRRKQLVGIVDPDERDAVLIGAVHGEPKICLYRVTGLVLVNCSSAFGKAPAPESTIGIGRASVYFELEIPGAARLFLPVDDCNHSQPLHTDAVGIWWGKVLVGVRGFEPPAPASRKQCSTRLSYTPPTGNEI